VLQKYLSRLTWWYLVDNESIKTTKNLNGELFLTKKWVRYQVLFEEKDAEKVKKIAGSQDRNISSFIRHLVKRTLALEGV
jgi:hypothetical protein